MIDEGRTDMPTLGVLAITHHGLRVAARIVASQGDGAWLHAPEKFAALATALAPGRCSIYSGKTAAQVPGLLRAYPQLVAVVSLGAVVRLIAPHLGDKTSDPGVVVVDEAARFVIPVLSGHLGGANALAHRLARALGATAVLTTASDARQTLAVDLLGQELGWQIEADHDTLVRVAAAMVNDEPVALVQEAGASNWWPTHANGRSGPLPANLWPCTADAFDAFDALDAHDPLDPLKPPEAAALLWISPRPLPAALAQRFAGRVICYRPPEGATP